MKRGLVRSVVMAVFVTLLAETAEGGPAADGQVDVRLVSESAALRPGSTVWVGLHQTIATGWHTYWRNPGDSGQPTAIEWTLPAGFQAGEIVWPRPARIPLGSAMSYGYEGEVLLLVPIASPAGLVVGRPVSLTARASWLVCEKICIPGEASLALELPVVATDPPINPEWEAAFTRARRQAPTPSPWLASFTVTPDLLEVSVTEAKLDPGRIADVWFYPFEWGLIDHAAPQTVTIGPRSTTLRVARGPLRAEADQPIAGVLVLSERLESGSETLAFTVHATPAARASASSGARARSLVEAMALALLGGLVLNLMPCVFPILSVKALSLLSEASASSRRHRLYHGAAYTAGVLAAFTGLAGVLLALRTAGEQVGWGFQLQSPMVVALIAYLLFALGLSLSGVFMIGGRVAGLGRGWAERPGPVGAFGTGALATIVATPCTAPFMGAALGFAVTQPALVALLVFEALGLGLALPYLALSGSPGLLRRLPRPGPWMERLKQLLAFPLYGSAAWLVWVLGLQTGINSAGAALCGMVLVAFAAWLYETTRYSSRRVRLVAGGGGAAAVVAAGALVALATNGTLFPGPSREEPQTVWQPFSTQRLAELQSRDVPVFVNFTASWCITCLVNERVALHSATVTARLADKAVVSLRGDWTTRDPQITTALSAFGRAGVPLYVVYPRPSSGRKPAVLPQILTERLVLDALDGV